MTDPIPTIRQGWTPSTRFLWGAVGVLGVAAVAMGAALVQVKMQTTEAAAPTPVVALSPVATVAASPMVTEIEVPKVPVAPVERAQAATKTIAKARHPKPPAHTTPTDMEVFEPAVATSPRSPAPAKVLCPSCGTVESVTAQQRETQPSGVGVVAGAVLGGLLGNQVGRGDGKNVATVLGALGGGWAGNTVEKRMKKELVYQIDVRMEDGSLRTLEQTTTMAVGAKVTVEGATISPRGAALADGAQ